MKIPFRKLKRILWFLFIISIFGIGCYLFLSISCKILLCSPQDIEKNETPYAEDFINEEKKLICSYLDMNEKGINYTIQNSPQLGKNGSYSIIYNYIKALRNYKINESVTYTTHTTPEYIKHIKELSIRWDGPISVAVYVPGYDFCSAITQIIKLRVCGVPQIREKVSWHIYWKEVTPPSVDWWKVDHKSFYNCSIEPSLPPKSWRALKGIQYPINVGRNVARNASETWFVLPSDVELYPSRNLAQQFISFIGNDNFTKKSNIRKVWPRVYVVPVFEVQTTVPDTKEELLSQISKGEANYFHRHVCSHCQRIPGLNTWLQNLGKKNQIHAFSSVKRQFPYHRWEPLFISTNNEPFYDERLSWEGLQDKMSQMHELCLRNYNLVILDRAFLVHSPGIKKRKKASRSEEAWREVFIQENSRVYDLIMNELQTKFGNNVKCRKH